MMIGERQRMSRAILFISRVQCYQFDSHMSTSSGLLSEFGIATVRLPLESFSPHRMRQSSDLRNCLNCFPGASFGCKFHE